MPANKVYNVSIDFDKHERAQVLSATMALRADILMLANAGAEEVYLHQFKDDTLGGAPGILL